MKEIDLRSKNLGSYEYPEIEDLEKSGTGSTGKHICLNDFTLYGRTIIRTSYGEGGNRYYEGHFAFEPFNFKTLAAFREHSDGRRGGVVKALANAISCQRLDRHMKPPLHSIVAYNALIEYGERQLKNIQDKDTTNEMYLMKAMVVSFLAGHLHVRSRLMACKITQDGSQYEYSFYFQTNETIPFNIGIKLAPDFGGGYLETISGPKITRYLI